MSAINILVVVLAFGVGTAIGIFIIGQRKFNESEILEKAKKLIGEAEKEATTHVTSAREHVIEMNKQFLIEQEEYVSQLEKMEKVLTIKNGSFQKREAKLGELERALKEEQSVVRGMREKNEQIEKRIEEELLKRTGIAPDRVKHELITKYENDFKADADARIQRELEWNRENAFKEGRDILAYAIYHYTAPTSVEHTHGDVMVARDEIKGKIIGRGGQNIAFFEEFFGVDVIFNDEPDKIIVDCFNLVNREIARQALKRLMQEKVITEDTIRRVRTLAEADVDKILRHEGENALKLLGIKNMPPDFNKLVGRLKLRTSYGQNILAHSFEVAYFSRMLASEIGANSQTALVAGFFHDLGKAIDQDAGGSHDVLTKQLLEQYNFAPEIVHAAWTHHDAAPQETIEAQIVQAADAISAGRPGARAESVERYLEKMKELQDTALAFPGVKKAFTINAGREVRVIVDSDKINDEGVEGVAKGIASNVQEKGGYPGKIKITAIRSTKITNHARK